MIGFVFRLLAAVLFSSSVLAQTYPAKPIRIPVPFPVGGIADIYSRLFVPAGTPPEIVGKLSSEVQKFMQSKEITARLTAEGARFISMTPEQFGNFVKTEIAKWAPVVKASGAKAD